MTQEELDKTVEILIDAKKSGQFRAFWTTFDESVNLMASGEVAIQSMWSPAVTAVRSRGIPCYYAPLKEGYRAWASGMGLMGHLEGMKLDAAYDYINWHQWGYWYEGQAAQNVITDPYGNKMEEAGHVRDGGKFWERMGNVACWNTVMDENRYMVRKWNEFIAA